jgi:hypothetical protein
MKAGCVEAITHENAARRGHPQSIHVGRCDMWVERPASNAER